MSRVLIYNVSVWRWKETGDAALVPFVLSSSCDRDTIGDVLPLCYLTVHRGFISALVEYFSDADLSDLMTRIPIDFDVVINGRSRLLLPGLVDSHIHVGLLGESRYFVDLSACCSMDELLSTLRRHIDLHAEHVNWIIGGTSKLAIIRLCLLNDLTLQGRDQLGPGEAKRIPLEGRLGCTSLSKASEQIDCQFVLRCVKILAVKFLQ